MKLLLVDDHAVVREGLRRLFAVHFDASVQEAATIDEAESQYRSSRPDAVVLDLNLDGAGGLEFLRRILGYDPNARIIIFSMHHEPIYAARALKAGAKGYVTKSAPVDALLEGVSKVAAGNTYIDDGIAANLDLSQPNIEDPLQSLSLREIEILRMLGQGKSMTAISESLGIAYKTVANISTQMKAKLGVDRTADLIRLAVETLRT